MMRNQWNEIRSLDRESLNAEFDRVTGEGRDDRPTDHERRRRGLLYVRLAAFAVVDENRARFHALLREAFRDLDLGDATSMDAGELAGAGFDAIARATTAGLPAAARLELLELLRDASTFDDAGSSNNTDTPQDVQAGTVAVLVRVTIDGKPQLAPVRLRAEFRTTGDDLVGPGLDHTCSAGIEPRSCANGVARAWGVVEELLPKGDLRGVWLRWSVIAGPVEALAAVEDAEFAAGWAVLFWSLVEKLRVPPQAAVAARLLDRVGKLGAVAVPADAEEYSIVGPGHATVEEAALALQESPPRLKELLRLFECIKALVGIVRATDGQRGQAFAKLQDAALLLGVPQAELPQAAPPDADRLGFASDLKATLDALFAAFAECPTREIATLRSLVVRGLPADDADTVEADNLGTFVHRVRTVVVTTMGCFPLELELFTAPAGFESRESIVYPDLDKIGTVFIDDDFRTAIDHGWMYALAVGDATSYRTGHWVRWSIDPKDHCPTSVEGASAGGAFAIGLAALIEDRELGDDVAVTAALDDPERGTTGKVHRLDGKVSWADEIRLLYVHPENLVEAERAARLFPTAPRIVAIPNADIGTIRDEFSVRSGAVRKFFRRLGRDEAVLAKKVRFYPNHAHGNLREYLVEAVVEDPDGAKHEEPLDPADLREHPSTMRFEDVTLDPKRPTLLLGEPGYGKTTLFWKRLTLEAIRLKAALDRGDRLDDIVVPLALDLGDLRQFHENASTRSLPELAADWMVANVGKLTEAERGQLKQWFEEKIEAKRYTLSLDAFDELADDKPTRTFFEDETRALGGIPLFVTSRYGHPALAALESQTLRLELLRPEAVRAFAQRYFRGKSVQHEQLLTLFRDTGASGALTGVPLLLAIIGGDGIRALRITVSSNSPRTAYSPRSFRTDPLPLPQVLELSGGCPPRSPFAVNVGPSSLRSGGARPTPTAKGLRGGQSTRSVGRAMDTRARS